MTESHKDKFTYSLIDQVKVQQYCATIAISKENSQIQASCWNMIKVFQFKKENMKQVNLINGHNKRITFLEFYKTYTVSSDFQGSLKFWPINRIYSQKFIWKIQAHELVILGLAINSEQNCIISSSQDQKIKFWTEKNGWQCSQTITDHDDTIYNLSLSEKGDKLISCSKDKQIFVIELQRNKNIKQWNIVQKIDVQKEGYRLCFISDNLFTFQQWGENFMDIYELDSTNKFVKTKSTVIQGGIRCDCLFPQQYIKQKNLLVNKNSQSINLIRKQENNEFITEMSIDLSTDENIYGQMSQDGQYLITWDQESSFLQIRKYMNIT
ncbi:unnamed protein product [Paramecium sonneborni]|uniref:WD40-repeat-containing domain n=1 Tax=Paramecium sonneborni TaxID=65129 RepID=A0A8S1RR07_9CILI|nr:unnamed protein product [Paramecium sonneborni]